jgi:hypothetical protein
LENSNPEKEQPDWVKDMLEEIPWQPPSIWAKYTCSSCSHTDWIEDIILDAFPPDEPGGTSILECPECGKTFLRDKSQPEVKSYTKPE